MINIPADLRKLGGAKGTRTPGLLHAISRQHVHPRLSPQVTVPERTPGSAGVRTGCCTFLLYSPAGPERLRNSWASGAHTSDRRTVTGDHRLLACFGSYSSPNSGRWVPHLCADWHIFTRDVERRPEAADDRRLRIVIRSQVTPAEYVPPVDGVFAAGEHTERGRLSGSLVPAGRRHYGLEGPR
jgi:hypothetical protein